MPDRYLDALNVTYVTVAARGNTYVWYRGDNNRVMCGERRLEGSPNSVMEFMQMVAGDSGIDLPGESSGTPAQKSPERRGTTPTRISFEDGLSC